MGSELLRRVRWKNVARAGVVVAVVAAVVAWPRLSPPAPRLPDRAARPLATPSVQRGDEGQEGTPLVPGRDEGQEGTPPVPERDEVREAAPEVPDARRSPRRRGGRGARRRHERAERRTRARRKRVPRRQVDPVIEGGGVAGPGVGDGTVGTVEGGGTRGRVTPGAGAPPPAPARDPAETEFGFER
jgi:hypothetical protein